MVSDWTERADPHPSRPRTRSPNGPDLRSTSTLPRRTCRVDRRHQLVGPGPAVDLHARPALHRRDGDEVGTGTADDLRGAGGRVHHGDGVGRGVAHQPVAAAVRRDGVAADAADQLVVTDAAAQRPVDQHVTAGAAVDHVGAAAAEDLVAVRRPGQQVSAVRAEQGQERVRHEQVAAVALGVTPALRAAEGDDHAERGALVGQPVALGRAERLLALVVPEVDQVVTRPALDHVADQQRHAVRADLGGAAVGAAEDLVGARTALDRGPGRSRRRSRRCRRGRRCGRRRPAPGSRRACSCRAGCRRRPYRGGSPPVPCTWARPR